MQRIMIKKRKKLNVRKYIIEHKSNFQCYKSFLNASKTEKETEVVDENYLVNKMAIKYSETLIENKYYKNCRKDSKVIVIIFQL